MRGSGRSCSTKMKRSTQAVAAAAAVEKTQSKLGWPDRANEVDDKVTCAAHSAVSPLQPGGKKELPTEIRLPSPVQNSQFAD